MCGRTPPPKVQSPTSRNSAENVGVILDIEGATAHRAISPRVGFTLSIAPPTHTQGEALSVHGTYAANCSVEATSLSAVRWTEKGMTYEISSRSLLLRDLVPLAEQVR